MSSVKNRRLIKALSSDAGGSADGPGIAKVCTAQSLFIGDTLPKAGELVRHGISAVLVLAQCGNAWGEEMRKMLGAEAPSGPAGKRANAAADDTLMTLTLDHEDEAAREEGRLPRGYTSRPSTI